MKTMLLCLFLAVIQPTDSLKVVFWNLENYFDWRDGGAGEADTEFSSKGSKRWTKRRFKAKSNAIAKTLLWAGTPDVVGLAEVENKYALKRLLEDTALRKLDYKIVHFDSPDPRGIDVALLYRSSRLKFVRAKPCHIYGKNGEILTTRDILLAQFKPVEDGQPIAFLVNHHPSKYSGVEETNKRRERAVKRLRALADSLQSAGYKRIVAMGDMNDSPANSVYKKLSPTLKNLAEPLHKKGQGTIRYDGNWELIDMFFVSSATSAGPMRILHPPFLTENDKKHGGQKPLRTYSGKKYLGGVSDHRPIMVSLPRK